MTKTPQEMQDINVKCAELLGLKVLGKWDGVLEVLIEPENEPVYMDAFSIFDQYADLMAVAEKLLIETNWLHSGDGKNWNAIRQDGENPIRSAYNDSLREAILQCVIAVVE